MHCSDMSNVVTARSWKYEHAMLTAKWTLATNSSSVNSDRGVEVGCKI